MNHATAARALCLAAALLAVTSTARADVGSAPDPNKRYGLDPDFPVRIEDAYPLEYGKAFLKFVSRFSQSIAGDSTVSLTPEVAWGFAPNFDVHVLSSQLITGGDRTDSGDINANVQWLPFPEKEGEWYPAVAVEADVIAPSGVNSAGLDTILQINSTKTLTYGPNFDEVHLDLTWQHNAANLPTARSDFYNVIGGYSRRIFDRTVAIGDFVWEETAARHGSGQLIEIGLIQVVNEHVQFSAGVGAGIGGDEPDYTATLGVIITD